MSIMGICYDCKGEGAVTTHISREVGPNIATASTVVLENIRGDGNAKDIEARAREVLRQTNGNTSRRGSTTGS